MPEQLQVHSRRQSDPESKPYDFVSPGFDHKLTIAATIGTVDRSKTEPMVVPTRREMTLLVPNRSGVTFAALDTPVLVFSMVAADLQALGVKSEKRVDLSTDNVSIGRLISELKPDWLNPNTVASLKNRLDEIAAAVDPTSPDRFNFSRCAKSFDRYVRLLQAPEQCSKEDRWLGSHICVAVCAAGNNGRYARIFMPKPAPGGKFEMDCAQPLDELPEVTQATIDDIWYLGSAGWTANEIALEHADLGITKKHVTAVFAEEHLTILGDPLHATPLASVRPERIPPSRRDRARTTKDSNA